jgi:hypothetical protein
MYFNFSSLSLSSRQTKLNAEERISNNFIIIVYRSQSGEFGGNLDNGLSVRTHVQNRSRAVFW